MDHHPFPDLDDELPDAQVTEDYHVNAEVLLPHGAHERKTKVFSRKRDCDCNPVGVGNKNPLLDTRV